MGLTTLNNVVVIQKLSDFPAPIAGVIKLEDNISYYINGSVNIGTNQIERGVSNLILGVDKVDDKIIYTGASAMFIDGISGANMDVSFAFITLSAITAGGSVFNISGRTYNCEIKDCIFSNCTSLGTITVGNICKVRQSQITNCANGISFSSGSVTSKLNITDVLSLSNTGTCTAITINNGTYENILLGRLYLNSVATQTGININSSITVTSGLLSAVSFAGLGNKLVGITHLSTNWLFTGNFPIANRLRFVYVNASIFSNAAYTNPATTAATFSVINTDSGNVGHVISGANNATTGTSLSFQVPADYFSGGYFEIVYSTDTGTPANVKLSLIVSNTAVNAQLNTQTETGLSVTFASTTQFLRQIATITPITSVFSANDFINIRLYRIANDVADTFIGNCYVMGFRFIYNSK